MTREEASFMLANIDRRVLEDETNEALDMAIKTLKQEPCNDAISRDELLKAMDTWDKFGVDANTKIVPVKDCYVPYIHYDDVIKCIKGMPSVAPQPKTGHWIDADGDNAICGCCNRLNHLYGTYCKHCGAKMEVEE